MYTRIPKQPTDPQTDHANSSPKEGEFAAPYQTPHALLRWQQTIGNRAVQRMLSANGGKTTIQRQSTPPGSPSPTAADPQLQRGYLELGCEVIAGIRAAIEEGRTWYFEDELLLQAQELLPPDQEGNLVRERVAALQELVRGIDEIMAAITSGELTPSEPASREALAALWTARNPRSVQALAQRWVPIMEYRRLPDGTLQRLFPSLYRYIFPATSPPGMLPSAEFPTWWALSCHALNQPEPAPAGDRATPADLGLTPDWVVYLGGRNDEIWDWEPRADSYPPALGPIYDWQQDEAGHAFIIMDGQRLYLLRTGRVEAQR